MEQIIKDHSSLSLVEPSRDDLDHLRMFFFFSAIDHKLYKDEYEAKTRREKKREELFC